MQGAKELKRRIKGVTNIQQITRAMEMVAANKLRKFTARTLAARPYFEKINDMVRFLVSTTLKAHPFVKERDVRVIKLLVITSDKGLCGAYNTNILQAAQKLIQKYSGKDVRLTLIGRKGNFFFQKRGYNIEKYFPQLVERIGYKDIVDLSKSLIKDFEQGAYDELHLLFTEYRTLMQLVPTTMRIFPVQKSEEVAKLNIDYIFEPPAEDILKALFPKYLESCIWHGLLESLTSEYAARRVAMIAASKNAEDMINELIRAYNKARQETITKELIEVVSGAEAQRRQSA